MVKCKKRNRFIGIIEELQIGAPFCAHCWFKSPQNGECQIISHGRPKRSKIVIFFPGLRQTGPKKHQTRIPMSRTGIRETLALTLLDLGALAPRRKDLSPPQKNLRAQIHVVGCEPQHSHEVNGFATFIHWLSQSLENGCQFGLMLLHVSVPKSRHHSCFCWLLWNVCWMFVGCCGMFVG